MQKKQLFIKAMTICSGSCKKKLFPSHAAASLKQGFLEIDAKGDLRYGTRECSA